MPRKKKVTAEPAPHAVQQQLKFVQLNSVTQFDGRVQLFALSADGYVYGFTGQGWGRLPHVEVTLDAGGSEDRPN